MSWAGFVLDEAAHQLWRDGEAVHLSPKAFGLLALLLKRRPEMVPRAELFAALWPATYVAEGSLAIVVAELRAALGESARKPGCIRTIHRRGYAFRDPSEPAPDPTAAGHQPTGFWLITTAGNLALRSGENVIGRDLNADVYLDGPGVSRRHACIRIESGRAVIEDIGSKNGTRAGRDRVSGERPIADGEVIHFGATAVMFRSSASGPTRTEDDPS